MKNLIIFGIIISGMTIFKNAYPQDRILFSNGTEMTATVLKATAHEVYYADTTSDLRQFSITKNEVKQINHANGDSIVFPVKKENPADPEIGNAALRDNVLRHKTFYCRIYGVHAFSNKVRRGFIDSVLDSGIIFRVSENGNSFISKNMILNYQNATDIEQIKVRRKGSVGKGILIGAGAGFFIGGIIGLANIQNFGLLSELPPGENALAAGTFYSIPGMLIGGLAGSVSVKIPIHKNQQQYMNNKKLIAHYIDYKNK